MCTHQYIVTPNSARQLGLTQLCTTLAMSLCNKVECNKMMAQSYNPYVTITDQSLSNTINTIKCYSLCTCKVNPTTILLLLSKPVLMNMCITNHKQVHLLSHFQQRVPSISYYITCISTQQQYTILNLTLLTLLTVVCLTWYCLSPA